jgi:FRG domain
VEADEIAKRRRQRMIRIAITVEAFEAIARTLPLGRVGFETKVNADGSRTVWLDPRVLDKLGAMRGPRARATATPFCGWRRPKAAKSEGHNMESAKIMLTDVAEVIEAARDVLRPFNNDTAWWRGHAKADWRLRAHVHRRDPKRQYDEPTLIGHFVSRAPSRSHRPCPDADDCLRWLFLAQHYGLPTRLLDWTESPLIAAYFAVRDHHSDEHHSDEDDGCIWALWPNRMNRTFGAANGLVQIKDRRVAAIAEGAFTGRDSSLEILAIDGQEIDPRMLAQMSRFTLHFSPTTLESARENEVWLRQYMIPKNAKAKIRAQLPALGIRLSNVFPDLKNLAGELRDATIG